MKYYVLVERKEYTERPTLKSRGVIVLDSEVLITKEAEQPALAECRKEHIMQEIANGRYDISRVLCGAVDTTITETWYADAQRTEELFQASVRDSELIKELEV